MERIKLTMKELRPYIEKYTHAGVSYYNDKNGYGNRIKLVASIPEEEQITLMHELEEAFPGWQFRIYTHNWISWNFYFSAHEDPHYVTCIRYRKDPYYKEPETKPGPERDDYGCGIWKASGYKFCPFCGKEL